MPGDATARSGQQGSAQPPQQLPHGCLGTGDAVVDGDAGVGGPDEAEGQLLLCQELSDALCGHGDGLWAPLWRSQALLWAPQAPPPPALAPSYLCAASGPKCTGGCRPGEGAAGEHPGTTLAPCSCVVPSPTCCTLTMECVGAGSRPSCSLTAACARCRSSAGATDAGSPKLCWNQAPPSIT